MPAFGPISRRQLIKYLRELGFEGPYQGRKHAFMVRGEHTPRIPNPHQSDISAELLNRILKQAGVSNEEWRNL